jgi:hypothetical protein
MTNLPIASKNAIETQDADVYIIMVYPQFWAYFYIIVHTHIQELVKLVWSHDNVSMFFMLKVINLILSD